MLIAAGLAALGVVVILAAALLLRSLGARYRIGRLLSATREASIDEAIELAPGAPVYVRVTGRISSNEEFPDEHDRPLVFRRKRLEARQGGTWRTMLDEREAVPFGIESRSSFIAVDETALADGLVSVPRYAGGRLSDLPRALLAESATGPQDMVGDQDPPARLIVEQLSAVEQATVCGRPALRDGEPLLTAGAGRPLIVSTLDTPAAMRVLAAGQRGRVIAAAGLLLAGLGLLASALVALAIGA